ncbi:MAG: energy-coupled thiamine transporter ThiT [Nitrososphaerales archaeon]
MFNISRPILAEAAMLIALAAALHLVRLFQLPFGGSITLGSMIPILLFSLRRGALPGILAGTMFGFIVLIEEPFIFHPFQVFLDYPLAFGLLGLAGIFKRNPIAGVAVAISGRFVAHYLSGIIFFAEFAPEGINPYLYSALYNGSFLSVEFAISGILIYSLFKRGILEWKI